MDAQSIEEDDFDGMEIPNTALWAISVFSAKLGQELASTSKRLITWARLGPIDSKFHNPDKDSGYFIFLEWNEEGEVSVQFDPASPKEWEMIYPLIGYCAYHKIKWEAP